jgi:hypothetical protein
MIDLMSLSQKCLVAVRIVKIHEKVDPAWQDNSNEGFLIYYAINFIFDDGKTYSIQPCEVDFSDRYPSLGLSLEEKEKEELSIPFNIADLPMRVCGISQCDHLGEDVTNQYVFIIENGSKVVIRHVFQPMTMGIKIESINA